MSKYSEFLENRYKTIRKMRDATRDLIKNGGDIALKEFHDANSLERLKRRLK